MDNESNKQRLPGFTAYISIYGMEAIYSYTVEAEKTNAITLIIPARMCCEACIEDCQYYGWNSGICRICRRTCLWCNF